MTGQNPSHKCGSAVFTGLINSCSFSVDTLSFRAPNVIADLVISYAIAVWRSLHTAL